MSNLDILDFVQKTLQELGIKNHILQEPFEWNSSYDSGLREHILESTDDISKQWPIYLSELIQASVITSISDIYHCEYICIRLPNEQGLSALFVGPFTYEKLTVSRIMELCNQVGLPINLNGFMRQYYQSLDFQMDDRWIKGLLSNLGKVLLNETEIKITRYNEEKNVKRIYNTAHPSPSEEIIRELENRYENERCIMSAIANGNLAAIDQMVENKIIPLFQQRFSDALRNQKNNLIIANTICRKSAEMGHIHPVYLDEMSCKFAFEIEQASTMEKLNTISKSMFRKYCLLVRSHSLKGYSKPIQQAINYISFNLTEDLSLSAVAKSLLLNNSYLSTLFKKETGMTLTYFANLKRVEHALFLLNTTSLPIQDIAIQCGIDDLNYFTKTFKKYQNMTPSEYRDMING